MLESVNCVCVDGPAEFDTRVPFAGFKMLDGYGNGTAEVQPDVVKQRSIAVLDINWSWKSIYFSAISAGS